MRKKIKKNFVDFFVKYVNVDKFVENVDKLTFIFVIWNNKKARGHLYF